MSTTKKLETRKVREKEGMGGGKGHREWPEEMIWRIHRTAGWSRQERKPNSETPVPPTRFETPGKAPTHSACPSVSQLVEEHENDPLLRARGPSDTRHKNALDC